MCRPARWLPGLIPLLLLFLGAVGLKVPEIRADLLARAGDAVASYKLGEAPSVSGRDVTLNGANFSDEARAGATAAADGVNGVRLVTDRTQLVPVAKPYALTATRDGDSLVLKGSAPNPEAKAALVAAARQIAPKVDDQTVLARGAAPGFDGWAKAALASLARLTKGSAELSDNGCAVTISGDAPDQAAYAAALAATKSLPAGLTLAKADIRPPLMSPYLWSATADGAAVTMEGAVPSEEARAAVLAAVRAALPGKTVVDRLQIARGAADGFANWTQAGLAALSKLTRGKASLSDSALTISGETGSSTAYQAALAATKGLPAGLRLAAADIAPPAISPFAWSARFDGKSLVLEGYVPSEEARAALLAAARAACAGRRDRRPPADRARRAAEFCRRRKRGLEGAGGARIGADRPVRHGAVHFRGGQGRRNGGIFHRGAREAAAGGPETGAQRGDFARTAPLPVHGPQGRRRRRVGQRIRAVRSAARRGSGRCQGGRRAPVRQRVDRGRSAQGDRFRRVDEARPRRACRAAQGRDDPRRGRAGHPRRRRRSRGRPDQGGARRAAGRAHGSSSPM